MANNAILGAMLLLIKTKADTSGLNKTDKALRKTGGAIKSMSKDIGLIGKLSKGFLGYLGIRGIGGIFNSYLQFEKDLGAMKSRFYAITKSDILADEEFEYIRKLATDTANDVKATADSYSIFYAAAQRSLGKEGARGIFETWTKIGRVLHLNEAQFERVTYALREMSSKGQLYSQDLKIQLGTHVPDAVNIAQEAIKNLGIAGVETVEDFQKYTKKNPKSDAMARFLKEFSRVAGQRFGSEEAVAKALKQPDALAKSIENIGYNFLVEFSRKGGNEAIINILNGIKDVLLSIDFNALANVFGTITKGMSVVFKYLPQIFWVLQKIALYFVAFRILPMALKNIRAYLLQWKMLIVGLKKGWDGLRTLALWSPLQKLVLGIAQQGLKGVLKGALVGLLGATGPLGWIASALMFLPEIVSIIKWIAKLKGWDNKKNPFMPFDVSNQAVLDMFKKLSTEKIDSQEKLRERVKDLTGSSMLSEQAYYDNGNIYIELNGVRYNDDVVEGLINGSVKAVKNSKKDMFANLYQKPNNKIDEHSQKVLRERYEWSTNL